MKNKTKCIQLLLLLLVFTFSATVAFGQNCGDINTDGSTDIVDALLVAQCYVSLTTCPSAVIGDVNCDGILDIVDALLIAQFYVNLNDSLECCTTPTETPDPEPTPGDSVTLEMQAETDATWDDAVIESDHPGYTGSGYVNTANSAGRWIEWSVDVSDPNNAVCVFTYAVTGSGRPMDVSVNNNIITSLSFPDTGAWSTWSTQKADIILDKGTNAIRLIAKSSEGAANIDKMDITITGGEVVTPSPIPTATPASTCDGTCPPAPSLGPFKIGLCDIYILKRQSLGAVDFAGDVGVDGLEIDMNSLRDADTFEENKLIDPVQAQEFLDRAAENNIEFSSIGMVGFLAQDITTKETLLTMMIPDTIQTMKNMGVTVAYLPIRGTNLKLNPDKRPAVVQQLKGTGALAVAAGVIFGIETTLTGEEEAALIDEIGSPGIKSYFNFKNPLEEGRDLIEELKIFGRDRIAQIHCTDEDGELLEDNDDIDMAKVRDTLNEMGWSGWLIMERSRVSSMSHRESFAANAEYLRSFFQ